MLNSWQLTLACVILISCASEEKRYEEGYIETKNDIRLFYQKLGDGDQKIIIPLGFWLYEDFRHLVNKKRTLVFYDMRNRFRSSRVEDSTLISIGKDVEDVETLRRHFGFEKISLIGESYLGLMVILYTLRYPERVDRVVQIGAVPYHYAREYPDSLQYTASQVDTTELNKLRRLYREGYHRELPREFSVRYWNAVQKVNLVADTIYLDRLGVQWGAHLKHENEWFPNVSRQIRLHFHSIQQLEITPATLDSVEKPVLTIHGTHDRNAPYGSGKEWAKLLPNARLLTVERAAHIPWIEQPKLVFDSINGFLNGKWPGEAVRIVEDHE